MFDAAIEAVLRRDRVIVAAAVFVGGVMNVLWIAAIAILVLAEKVVPAGRVISCTACAGLFAGGAWLLAQALLREAS